MEVDQERAKNAGIEWNEDYLQQRDQQSIVDGMCFKELAVEIARDVRKVDAIVVHKVSL